MLGKTPATDGRKTGERPAGPYVIAPIPLGQHAST
jgi:hypothetical protein